MGWLDRFWARVAKSPGCWLWTGEMWEASRDASGIGYGRLKVEGKSVRAHRLSYEIHRGPIPAGMMVCHRCDVRNCVNPEHLFLGTSADNVSDMVVKGRGIRGERQHLSKLTADAVTEIRRLRATGLTYSELGAIFSIRPENASFIARRITWKHVQ